MAVVRRAEMFIIMNYPTGNLTHWPKQLWAAMWRRRFGGTAKLTAWRGVASTGPLLNRVARESPSEELVVRVNR